PKYAAPGGWGTEALRQPRPRCLGSRVPRVGRAAQARSEEAKGALRGRYGGWAFCRPCPRFGVGVSWEGEKAGGGGRGGEGRERKSTRTTRLRRKGERRRRKRRP